MSIPGSLTLPTGQKMPIFGLGTYKIENDKMSEALNTALDCGYRLIDTALVYQTEHAIGKVLKERLDSGMTRREDVFVTTKLGPTYMGSREGVRRSFQRSIEDLQLDYIDLYLIHIPWGMKLREDEALVPFDENGRLELDTYDFVKTWQYMEELVDEGKVKAIGLSNFNSKQIERIRVVARHPISNLQVECHVYLRQHPLFNFCKERNITFTAYSPLGFPDPSTGDQPKLQKDPVVVDLATKNKKTPAQILLRYLLQRGMAVVCKSQTPSRIQENIQAFNFKLSEDDMKAIEGINISHRFWHSRELAADHPDYPFNETF